MLLYNLDIGIESEWIITTPSQTSKTMPFYLTELGKFFANSNYYTNRSEKDGFYLLYTLDGKGFMEIDNESFELLPNQALLINCYNSHLYKTISEKWVNYWIHLDGTGIEGYYQTLGNKPVIIKNSEGFVEVLDNIKSIANKVDIISVAQISHNISELLTEMLINMLNDGNKINHLHHKGINDAINYIKKNYKKQISIDDIVKDINISKFHFVRLFRKHTGTTPYNYLINYRINKSKKILCTTDLSVSEISYLVGFLSESNYINQFHKVEGITPSQYRKTNINWEYSV